MRLYEEFRTFLVEMTETTDLVNEYLVMRELAKYDSRERQLWLTALYLAYVNLPSAAQVWWKYPDGLHDEHVLWDWNLPIGTERRGLRVKAQLLTHLSVYAGWRRAYGGSQDRWWTADFIPNPEVNYETFWKRALTVAYNGRWAAHKWCELARYTNDLPIAAPDLRLRYSSGPRWGLQVIFETDATDPAELERRGMELRERLSDDLGRSVDCEHVETALCNFHSLYRGRYYVGSDIDRMQAEIEASPGMPAALKARLYEAREAALPERMLGEKMGWNGVRRGLAGREKLELAL